MGALAIAAVDTAVLLIPFLVGMFVRLTPPGLCALIATVSGLGALAQSTFAVVR